MLTSFPVESTATVGALKTITYNSRGRQWLVITNTSNTPPYFSCSYWWCQSNLSWTQSFSCLQYCLSLWYVRPCRPAFKKGNQGRCVSLQRMAALTGCHGQAELSLKFPPFFPQSPKECIHGKVMTTRSTLLLQNISKVELCDEEYVHRLFPHFENIYMFKNGYTKVKMKFKATNIPF